VCATAIAHAHLHVIPRYHGDAVDPRGGIPWVPSIESSLLGGSVTDPDQRGAIGFAERVLDLLDEGRYTATYKYAVLLALLDVCLERTASSGAPPDSVTTRQLADKTVEFYWPHPVPFAGQASPCVLRQNAGG
jgi:hypothetical protein